MNSNDLFQAIRRGDAESFFEFISTGDLNQLNPFQQNALHESIAYKRPAFAREVIRRGINVNQQDYKGQTPLHVAASYHDTEIVREILKRGADVSLADKYGNGPLWTAVFNAKDSFDLVRLLVEAGRILNSPTKRENRGSIWLCGRETANSFPFVDGMELKTIPRKTCRASHEDNRD